MPGYLPGTTRLEFDWKGDEPWEVNLELLALEEYLEHTEVLAEIGAEVTQADIRERFQTETDPDGIPWAPLVKPAENQIGILRLTDRMYSDATSDEAFLVTPTGTFFRTDVLPEYWIFHEEGTSKMPQRRFVGLSADAQRKLEAAGEAWLAVGVERERALGL